MLVAGFWWYKEIIARLRDDIEELNEDGDPIRKTLIVFIWIVKLVAMFLIGRIFWSTIRNVFNAFRQSNRPSFRLTFDPLRLRHLPQNGLENASVPVVHYLDRRIDAAQRVELDR